MFVKLGSLIVNRKKLIFSIFIVAILSAGVIGSSVFGKLDSGGYNDPKSDSSKAFEYLTDVFKVKDPAVVLVVETKDGLTEPDVVASATKLETALKSEAGVGSTLSYWSAGGAPSLKSSDSKSAFLFVYSEDVEWDTVQGLGNATISWSICNSWLIVNYLSIDPLYRRQRFCSKPDYRTWSWLRY